MLFKSCRMLSRTFGIATRKVLHYSSASRPYLDNVVLNIEYSTGVVDCWTGVVLPASFRSIVVGICYIQLADNGANRAVLQNLINSMWNDEAPSFKSSSNGKLI